LPGAPGPEAGARIRGRETLECYGCHRYPQLVLDVIAEAEGEPAWRRSWTGRLEAARAAGEAIMGWFRTELEVRLKEARATDR
jgi:hypothetical protein